MLQGVTRRPVEPISVGGIAELNLTSGQTSETFYFEADNLHQFPPRLRRQAAARWPLVGVEFNNLNDGYRFVIQLGGKSERFNIPSGGVFPTPPYRGFTHFSLTVTRDDGNAFAAGEKVELDMNINDPGTPAALQGG